MYEHGLWYLLSTRDDAAFQERDNEAEMARNGPWVDTAKCL